LATVLHHHGFDPYHLRAFAALPRQCVEQIGHGAEQVGAVPPQA
jgi:hypothetical protein